MKYCPNCSKEVNKEADFCLSCAKAINKVNSLPKKKWVPGIIIAIVFSTIFALLFVIIFVIGYKETYQDRHYDDDYYYDYTDDYYDYDYEDYYNYEFTSFIEIDEEDLMNLKNTANLKVFFLGNKDSEFSNTVALDLIKTQNEFGYTTYFLDYNDVDEDEKEYQEFVDFINSGTTVHNTTTRLDLPSIYGIEPLIIITENGIIKDAISGKKDYRTLSVWLLKNGFTN